MKRATKKRTVKKTVKKTPTREILSPHWTWAIFGESGVGKTTLAATAPKPKFLDSNRGLLAVDGRPGFEHVSRHPVNGWRSLERAYDNFTGTGKRDWHRFGTVVFDHFDDIQGLVLDDLTEQASQRDPRRMIDTTEQREWGIMLNRLRRQLRKYKSLPMHKVLILSVAEDKITGKAIPALSGALRNQFPYFCDMIGYMSIDNKGRRVLSFRTSSRYLAKWRPWWGTDRDKRMVVPDADDNPRFLTELFESIAAGPSSRSTNSGERTQE